MCREQDGILMQISSPAGRSIMFGAISLALLCVNGPLARVLPQVGGFWIVGLFLVLLLPVIGMLVHRDSRDPVFSLAYPRLLLFYAMLIVISGGIHYAGLAMVAGDMLINAEGMSASHALKQERAFALMYLLFPLMLLAQFGMLRTISLRSIIRWLAFATVLTSCVAIYQRWFDGAFLHAMSWGLRYEGLATDPNALAITGFLLIPLLFIGACIEKKALRFSCLFLAGMLLVAILGSGNRTGTVGVLLFLLTLPWVFAFSMQHWNVRWRLVLAFLPVVICAAVILFSTKIIPVVETMDHTGSRLAQTWKKFEANGFHGVFFQGEARGIYLLVGKALVVEAPWAGWGPAGFYRESSNMTFLAQRNKGYFRDSAVNHYLMIAGDFGIPLLLLNLTVILIPVMLGFAVFRHLPDAQTRLGAAILMAGNILFLLMIFTIPPSYFLGACWVWTAHLALLLIIAERNGVVWQWPQGLVWRRGIYAMAGIIAIIVVVGSYQTAFGDKYGYAIRAEHPWWQAN